MAFLDDIGLSRLVQKIQSIFLAKDERPIAGDGLSDDDSVFNVSLPVRGVFTQEEYNALNEEKRQKGFSVVLDNEDLDAASDFNIYSLNEIIVGRWIDGKPIYRKTVITPHYDGGNKFVIVAENVSWIVNAYGIAINSSGTMFNIPNNNGVSDRLQVVVESGSIIVRSAGFTTYKLTITVEYTKTTDEPTIDLTESIMTLELSNDDYPIQVTDVAADTGAEVFDDETD